MSRNESSNPRMIELIPTMAVMPMTTPRTVSAERILFARIVPMAIAIVSAKSATLTIDALFPSERFDRIEPRRLDRRVEAEEEPTTAVIPIPIATE